MTRKAPPSRPTGQGGYTENILTLAASPKSEDCAKRMERRHWRARRKRRYAQPLGA
ncbi:hypothetical protein [Hyphomonas sp.]|jgi:hypothetical protein|uniref:hypothetical protein n=1 Tax=Hyphomonas sp. TaxID=87 RepID=UPI003566832F